jgi:hypothetical protein
MRRRLKDDEAIEQMLKILAERGPMTPSGLSDYLRFNSGRSASHGRVLSMLLRQEQLGTVESLKSPGGRYTTFRFVPHEERTEAVAPPVDEVAAGAAELSRPAAPALAAAILDLSAALTLHAEAIVGYAEMVRAACAPPPPSNSYRSLRDIAAIPTAG